MILSLCRLHNHVDYSLQYYDLVLLCIAASLVGSLIGYATPVALEEVPQVLSPVETAD